MSTPPASGFEREIMDVLGRLYKLLHYYTSTRQIGHTTALLNGARMTHNVVILAHTQQHADHLVTQCYSMARARAWYGLADHTFMGLRAPLLIDNSAMLHILSDATREIESLRAALLKEKKRCTDENMPD